MFATNDTNEKIAQKLGRKALLNLQKVLVLVGKPFYLIVSYFLVFLLFVFYSIGQLLLSLVKKLFILITSFVKSPQKIRAPSIKIRSPKFRFPIVKVRKSLVYYLVFISSVFFLVWFFIFRNLPSPNELTSRAIEVSTKIYDRNGVLLYKIYKDKNRTLVPLEEIPMNVRLATLAAEDAEFYMHPGFSLRGIIRALVRNVTRGELTGGSTITQQLVKNALLSSEKTIIRKVREIVLAMRVEMTFSKDQILEMYLNEVSYGGTAYGVQEAARVYFDKDVNNLSLAEAALLAGLPKSPSKFSPFGSQPTFAIERQKDVLNLMVINKFITEEQRQKALSDKLTFAQNKIDIKAPHFVMYVRQILAEKYGEEVVEKGGLEVVTTLDYSIQLLAEKSVKNELEKINSLNVGNGAVVVLNPQTGEILAMVGSKDYFDTANDGNVNVTTSPRQPGSSIKIVNYAYALSHGYSPATIISDSPITFSIPGSEPYSPKNYDGAFKGNVSLRSALAESRNVPAVKVLAGYGVDKMIEMGEKMGITTWQEKNRFGLSLTLGGGDVTLLDLARAYATVANYGNKPQISSIISITNQKGRILEDNECVDKNSPKPLENLMVKIFKKDVYAAEAVGGTCEEKVLDPRVAFILIDILKDNVARSPAFGLFSQLVIPNHPEVAVKTGTSNNLRDNLTVGFNQNYLVAVWVGNNDNSPMSRVASGVTGASPIFNQIMSRLLAGEKSLSWDTPDNLAYVDICTITGTLPCQSCPTKKEWFLKESTPKTSCTKEDILAKEKEKLTPQGNILPEAAQTERRQN